MSQILVYDLESTKWYMRPLFLDVSITDSWPSRYNVTATGNIPVGRANFCSTISSSPDDSSFQITIYGGGSLATGRGYEDVFVLTIPSFKWIQISDKGNQDNTLSGESIGRTEHTCNLYGDRQMVVLGGDIDFGDQLENNVSCNEQYAAIRVLDTTTFEWQKNFSPNPAAYSVPDAVSNIIGGR